MNFRRGEDLDTTGSKTTNLPIGLSASSNVSKERIEQLMVQDDEKPRYRERRNENWRKSEKKWERPAEKKWDKPRREEKYEKTNQERKDEKANQER
jgi:hypothetical protein